MIIGPIAAANLDAVIGVIAVVVWLILQGLSKRGGANTPPTPPPASGDGDSSTPQDDLRRFFEELEKGVSRQASNPAPTPPELPPPTAPKPPPVRQQGLTRADVHGKSVSAKRQPPTASPVPVSIPLPARITPAAPKPPSTEFAWNLDFPETLSSITTLRISDHPDHSDQAGKQRPPSPYYSRKTLRQMIVGTEVLGKPVALRRSPLPLT